MVVLAGGAAEASASGVLHFTYSNNWQGDTFVEGLDTCPLFGTGFEFSDVNLTDHVMSTWTPVVQGDILFRIHSVGTVSGVIYAADGTYTVTSRPLVEKRIDITAFSFFVGSGLVTISGPGGTVTGRATFTDFSLEDSQLEEFVFTNVISCQLN